jgi:hypothetical protein
MPDENFEVQIQRAKKTLVSWMVEEGAEIMDTDEDLVGSDEEMSYSKLIPLSWNDVEYFIGDATCDPSHFYELVTDKDYKLIEVSQNGHHHFEIAAFTVSDSPLSIETLNEKVEDLRPDIVEAYVKKDDTFLDGSMKTSFCQPFTIEASTDGDYNNVWVVRRFRVQDIDDGSFVGLMTEFLTLVNQVQEKFDS